VSVVVELPVGILVRGRIRDVATNQAPHEQTGVVYFPLVGNTFYRDTPAGDAFKQSISGYPVKRDGTFQVAVGPGPGVLLAQVQDGSGRLSSRYLLARRPAKPGETSVADKGNYLVRWDNQVIFLDAYQGFAMIDPKPDERTRSVAIQLTPGQTRSGSVVDSDGKPVSGATVGGLRQSSPMGQYREQQSAEFTVQTLDGSQRRFLIGRHERRKLAGACTVTAREQGPIVLKLERWGALRGRLVDADRKPLAGVQIEIAGYIDEQNQPLIAGDSVPSPGPVVTDADGRFDVEGFVPGQIASLMLSKSGYPITKIGGLERIKLGVGETRDLGAISVERPASAP
jgi:hypothetical protein